MPRSTFNQLFYKLYFIVSSTIRVNQMDNQFVSYSHNHQKVLYVKKKKGRVFSDFIETETRNIIFQLELPQGDMLSDRFRQCKESQVIDNHPRVLEMPSISNTFYHNPHQMIYWNRTNPLEPTPLSDSDDSSKKWGKGLAELPGSCHSAKCNKYKL